MAGRQRLLVLRGSVRLRHPHATDTDRGDPGAISAESPHLHGQAEAWSVFWLMMPHRSELRRQVEYPSAAAERRVSTSPGRPIPSPPSVGRRAPGATSPRNDRCRRWTLGAIVPEEPPCWSRFRILGPRSERAIPVRYVVLGLGLEASAPSRTQDSGPVPRAACTGYARRPGPSRRRGRRAPTVAVPGRDRQLEGSTSR